MRLALVVACITLASLSPAARAGGGGILIPPLEVDLGVGAAVGTNIDRIGPSTEVLVGAHWASLAWRPTRLDVGIGYAGSFRIVDDPMTFDEDELRLHGGYFALGTTIASGSHWRTWLVARGELLRASYADRDASVLGGALRISTELFGATAASANKAALVGTFALGIYVEATYRDLPAHLGPIGLTSGISCRLPFVVAGS